MLFLEGNWLFRYEKAKKDIFAEYKPVAESSVVKDLNDRKRFKKKKLPKILQCLEWTERPHCEI
jgi:hypothetical protein